MKTAQVKNFLVKKLFQLPGVFIRNAKKILFNRKAYRYSYFFPFLIALVLFTLSGVDFTPKAKAATPTPSQVTCPSSIVYESGGKVYCVQTETTNESFMYQSMFITYASGAAGLTGNNFTPVPHGDGNNVGAHWSGSVLPLTFDTNPIDPGVSSCNASDSDTHSIGGTTIHACCASWESKCYSGWWVQYGSYREEAGTDCNAFSSQDNDCSQYTAPMSTPFIHTQLGHDLTCEQEDIKFKAPANSTIDGKFQHVLDCSSNLSTVCNMDKNKQAGYLRASAYVDGGGGGVRPITNDLSGSPDDGGYQILGLTFDCVDSSVAGVDLPPAWVDLPTQSQCDISYTNDSNTSKNYCDWSPGNGGGLSAPSGTINCSADAYRTSHPEECSCTYDLAHHVANGNTYTAVGCIQSNIGAVLNVFITISIAFASVFALIRMMIGGYEIMTNPAGPEEIGEGKNMIVNAALGLLFIVLCVVILRIIGISILQINVLSNLFGS